MALTETRAVVPVLQVAEMQRLLAARKAELAEVRAQGGHKGTGFCFCLSGAGVYIASMCPGFQVFGDASTRVLESTKTIMR